MAESTSDTEKIAEAYEDAAGTGANINGKGEKE
jgi:hypothetical protein